MNYISAYAKEVELLYYLPHNNFALLLRAMSDKQLENYVQQINHDIGG